jgi:hypothetical protein
MRSVLLSLLAVLIGGAMVAFGVRGVIQDVSDDDDSASASTAELKTSSAKECSAVAERDPRFRRPHDLQFGGRGKAIVQCKGTTVTFSIDVDGLQDSKFYEVVLEKGRRTADVGTFLELSIDTVPTVTVPPDIKLKKYDFLTIRPDSFHNPEVDEAPLRAAL